MDRKNRLLIIRNVMIWLVVIFVGVFWLSARASSQPLTLRVMPEMPREGSPIIASFKVSNPSISPQTTDYRFYADGQLLLAGQVNLEPRSSEVYRYAYEHKLRTGEQVNFVVETSSGQGDYQQAVSIPAFAPQISSSFVSFATFAMSMMSSMATMVYYDAEFGTSDALNVGILCALVLMAILMFLEVTGKVVLRGRELAIVTTRTRLSMLNNVLIIIFFAMVLTKVILISTM